MSAPPEMRFRETWVLSTTALTAFSGPFTVLAPVPVHAPPAISGSLALNPCAVQVSTTTGVVLLIPQMSTGGGAEERR